MNPVTYKVLLETRSRVLRQSVTDCLSSMGIELCNESSDDIAVRLVHLTSTTHSTLVRDTRVPIVFIGDVTELGLEDIAAASVPFPFLSNELRKIVGRILQVPVRDSEAYDLADRPVPTSRRAPETKDVVAQVPESRVKREPPALKTPAVAIPPLDTQADLPQVSHLEAQRSSLHYAEETVNPRAVVAKDSVGTMPADVIETISEAYIEKVVWEVVPRLAERILREEIARVLRDESSQS